MMPHAWLPTTDATLAPGTQKKNKRQFLAENWPQEERLNKRGIYKVDDHLVGALDVPLLC